MIISHVTVKIGDMTIPLIGVPPSATLEKCDQCKKQFNIQQVRLIGKKILCFGCSPQTRLKK